MGVDIDKWVDRPLELLGMDLVGKVTKTDKGNEYICVWGPKRILTDQGREFVNQINKDLCDFLGVERSLCAPYHPQTNGLVEKLNGTIQKALCKLVEERPEKWDEYLDAVMFGLRTKPQLTTRYSPFFLMFGFEARYPSEVPETFEVNSTVENILTEDTVSGAISLKEKIDHMVKENVKKKQERRQKVQNQAQFSVGQKVLRKNIRSQQRKGGKLERSWLGPFEIIQLKEKSADLRDEKGHIYPKISTDHLKLFKVDGPHVPHRILAAQQNQRPDQHPSPTPLDLTITKLQPQPSPPSSPNAPQLSPCVSPKSSSSLSPLNLTVSLSSPPSHTTTVEVLAQADSKDAKHGYLKSAWKGNESHVLLSKVGPYKLFYSDISRLRPGMELESEVINAYLTLKVKEHNEKSKRKAYAFNTFTMSELWKGKPQRFKVDPAKYDVLLGIVNECHHWFLMAIYPAQRKAILLDSLGETEVKKKKCLETASAIMKKLPVSHWVCETLPHPHQKDGTSCGVFALKFAEYILKEKEIDFCSAPQEVKRLRLEIASTLLDQSDDLSDLCHFCGEAETFDESENFLWISCDQCGRWFHVACVNNPATEADYKCFSCK
ncbi:uncharacterized protein [Danio rerio]|uniref:Uncharacterized protein n=1 Tax=Danio rerio TaxID=7955 RepID=A0AC58J8M7_DANRE